MTHVSPATPTQPVPLIDLAEQHTALASEISAAFESVTRSGQFILGKHVEAFEAELAEYCEVKHAIGVSSGTDALLVALMAMDVGPGDEVITTPFTWFSTASVISRLGATPVFVDVNPRTYNIDTTVLEGAITERTKVILPVHLFGLPASLEPILTLAKKHNIRVIEDAAQAIGAKYHGKMVGGLGDVGTTSFYPTKNLAAMGDSGACLTNDDELAEKIRLLRNHGMDRAGQFPQIGGNFRLDGIQAAILSVKLPHLNTYTAKRREHAERYAREFESLPISTPFQPETRFHVFNQFTVRVRAGQRDALRYHLKAQGIGSRVYYDICLHEQPCFADLGYQRGSFPVSEKAADEVLSLPVFPELTEAMQDRVIQEVRELFRAE